MEKAALLKQSILSGKRRIAGTSQYDDEMIDGNQENDEEEEGIVIVLYLPLSFSSFIAHFFIVISLMYHKIIINEKLR